MAQVYAQLRVQPADGTADAQSELRASAFANIEAAVGTLDRHSLAEVSQASTTWPRELETAR